MLQISRNRDLPYEVSSPGCAYLPPPTLGFCINDPGLTQRTQVSTQPQATEFETGCTWDCSDAIDLAVDGHNVLGLYTEPEDDTGRAAVIVHGIGVHPNWPQALPRGPMPPTASCRPPTPIISSTARTRCWWKSSVAGSMRWFHPETERALGALGRRGSGSILPVLVASLHAASRQTPDAAVS